MNNNREKNETPILSSIPKKNCGKFNGSLIYANNNPKMTLMPQKFSVADGTSSFSTGRRVFLNTNRADISYNINDLTNSFNNLTNAANKKLCNCDVNCGHINCRCNYCNNSKNSKNCNPIGKSINVQSSDTYIQRIKNRAIGRSSMAQKNKDDNRFKLSFAAQNSANINTVNQALRRNRNRGYVVSNQVIHGRSINSCKTI